MSPNHFSWELFKKTPIIGIVRNLSAEDVMRIFPIYRNAGLTTIEITLNTPGAEELIRFGLKQEKTGLNIGAGTVCTEQDLERALAAGAQFIVTPIINENVIKTCVEHGIPIFPGAFSPSEIYRAWSLGAPMVKVFPAASLGVNYIKEVKGPLNQVKLVPTGGVGLANMADFLKAGADGLGIGGQLFDSKLIKKKDDDSLKSHFEKFISQLKTAG
ncbi:bifunctional 4-hydroxy-2-oxoglutarate aldolase/2-dehydro-3-deoxy-phosphogluconate aldolase [Larkinella terrae]|uniref:Bifunctional 4-hydroxy-2-oxoglutarate aldolase/2-dehydro-3-deoxy-phosphogluconate aldolase n=1 Tax=Larkinella terrae TaxID=2025311 RepID=A0A7K0EPU4_9BACT|nr:bifunctional 4-hydroxy-2-oxoglutarate aldolase/2-dehydro-3-deoxy-phosphogluconate aldolase [Larkinella terrae]MRS63829.1 bifunctional 4-hydroxy-2-oxoglutarate aldolase/2-dehydro-3-deoxy-phosphogluconate aldolase [Larkinella terrae]